MEKKEQILREEKSVCGDRDCPFHGKLRTHGRVFKGSVKKKFDRRVVIEFERMVYVPKYERYSKGKTKLHARLPHCMKNEINVGDIILIKECRPLSKIVHFVVIRKIKSGGKKNETDIG
ncbi:MAG: 30S ribosomal protein S17 [Candidatus Pacearchaeota archaeon]